MGAVIGFGVKFQRESDTPDSYVNIGELIDITPPAMSRDVVESTHYESTDRIKTWISALRDVGEVSGTIQLDAEADLDNLIVDWKSDAARSYRIIWPDGTTQWDFDGLITEVAVGLPIDDRATCDFTIRIVAKPNWVP